MKKRIIFIFFISFLFIPCVSSSDLDNFYLGLNYSNNGEYVKSIEVLENNCLDPLEDRYHSAQCYFALCYNYYRVWEESKIVINYGEKSYFVGSKEDIYLLNKSNKNCLKTINLSWSELTDKGLKENKQSGFLISGISFLINNYLILEEYSKAEEMVGFLNTIRLLDIPNEKTKNIVESTYIKFYSALPKKVEVELIGDIGPLFFSQPEIKPNIILESVKDPNFNLLHTEYRNLNGLQKYKIEKNNKSFIFEKKLVLNKRDIFFYPLDSYSFEIFNITPNRIKNGILEVSIIGENSNLKGIAIFEEDNIFVVLTRKISYILRIGISFLLLIIGLIFFNRRIKYMEKRSFQPKNLIGEWSFDLSILSLIFFITSDFKNILNLLSLIIFGFLIITGVRFYKKRKRLFS